MDIYEKEKILMNLRAELPRFKEEELVEYTKSVIPDIHRFLCHGESDKITKYCSDEVIQKMLLNKDSYRISQNMDSIGVQHARLFDFSNSDNKIQIKMYASVFFYDDVDNNINNEEANDKYWNDIWIVTYELEADAEILNKCPSCGATMEYNSLKHMFICNYCRNSVYYGQMNWKIVDIEVDGITNNE